ncbi:MAG: PepSY-associated TM helix domain-containing protein [Bacteroidota bacterium]
MKKLKGLKNRAYHVMFHTHMVAGIVISFALFVIFYAGAFSLFRYELAQWENPFLRKEYQEEMDIDKALEKVDSIYAIDQRKNIFIQLPSRLNPTVTVSARSANTPADTTKSTYFQTRVSPSLEVMNAEKGRTTVADTMYHLHYFAQLGLIGQFTAGFVGLFFLFAIVSGVLIHWSKLLTRFYAFVREGQWKVIWTNAHTVLGIIGLPFQIMYAVTGAFFGLVAFVILLYVIIGKQDMGEAEAQGCISFFRTKQHVGRNL